MQCERSDEKRDTLASLVSPSNLSSFCKYRVNRFPHSHCLSLLCLSVTKLILVPPLYVSSLVPALYPLKRCLITLSALSLFLLVKAASQVRFPRFRGTSYLALPTVKDAERSMQVNIDFRPEKNEGLILYSGEKSTLEGDFVALLLNEGFVEFR